MNNVGSHVERSLQHPQAPYTMSEMIGRSPKRRGGFRR